MTSRNLNTTWRDIIFKQYREDHEADVAFPVRYLLHNPQWKKDLWYEIPKKIDPDTFRRSIIAFHRATRGTESPNYQDDNITVRPRQPHAHTETPDIQSISARQDDAHEAEDADATEPSLAGPATS
ncbi:hypothetical protein PVAG01_00832 [Phlyctema vagabunda]|uniref:Uncharacterized protein n=1 Tax=Phlyctema vagabunda TaxID=108571 RepID=A0ABR4PVE3_9HELO